MIESNYSSDSPVNDINQDRFNRYPFAKRISELISNRSDPSSIVIGINGAWGEGKTSVFNFIKRELEAEEHIVILKFNPWRFVSEEIMLSNFFNELAQSIDKSLETNTEKLGNLITKFGKPIGTLVGKGEIVDGVASFFSGADLEELRNRIEDALAKEQKRVVILIDDIDRLDKNEIHSLFRLIKLSADFMYTAYVLAFDKEVVSSALQDRYSYSDNLTGMSFLEKIIQIPLQLPLAENEDLREFCVENIDNILQQTEIYLTDRDAGNFMYHFNGGLELFLKTPRQAKLYSNILSFSLPLLKEEVNVVDLMLIEGIRVFLPEIYNFIKNNREIFLTDYRRGYGAINENEERKRRRELIDKSLEKYDYDEREAIRKIYTFLFPRIENITSNIYYRDVEENWDSEQRICSKNYFQRYFSYSVSNKDVSDQNVNHILEIANKYSTNETIVALNEVITEKNRESLFIKLRRKSKNFSDKQAENLIMAIVKISDTFQPIEGYLKFTKYGEVSFLIPDCLSSIKDSSSRMKIIKEAINLSNNLDFAMDFFAWVKKAEIGVIDSNDFTDDEYTEIGKFLVSKISNNLNDGTLDIFHLNISRIIHLWYKYGSREKLFEYIDGLLELDNLFIFSIINSFIPIGYGANGKIIGDLKNDVFEDLVNIFDSNRIIKVIDSAFPEIEIHEDFPSYITNTDDQRNLLLAKQFKWHYNNK